MFCSKENERCILYRNDISYIPKEKFKKIYGVDINAAYLRETMKRYPKLDGRLECLCLDLINEPQKLSGAELIIADLLIEYIGYEHFQETVRQVNPRYVSCVIQINLSEQWVSDSPYLHVFDGLERVHTQIEETTLEKRMSETGYHVIGSLERRLPNGKKFVRLDFEIRLPQSR